MGWFSWLFGEKEDDDEAEPLVLGAKLECEYGMHPSYLFVESEDIDLNNLPQACIKDSKALVNVLPFGTCNFNHECSISMLLEDEWINKEPQKVLANGYPILTKKNSRIKCVRTGMEIRPITTGQDGIFAKQLQFLRQMDIDYPGLRSILEDPYGSLYLEPGKYQMALKFLEDMMNSEGGEFELIYLYDPNNVKGLYMKAAMERLLTDCDFKSHELLMEDLISKAIQNDFLDATGWDKNYLNAFMMEFINEEAREHAAKVEAGGVARWSEEHKRLTNWAAESAYTMAYGTMIYSHIKAAQPNKVKGRSTQDNKNNSATNKVNKKDKVYIPRDKDGNPIPLAKQRVNGQDIPLPDPNATGPHTVLGGKVSSKTGEVYRQSATFMDESWPTANGYNVPLSEVHWSDHGRAHQHTNPHQHVFKYDKDGKGGWYRGDPEYFNN